MTRIEKTFKSLNRPALITFVMGGDPDAAKSLEILKSLPKAGADIIEIGMPFTDPMADGPVIQAAGLRALESGMTLQKILKLAQQFRKSNQTTPLVLMGYANPLYAYGLEKFVQDAAKAGVDGFIIVDLPPEEDTELRALTQKHNIDLIRLLTPTTDKNRLPKVLDGASGFLYYISVTGITGAKKADPAAIKPHLDMIRKHTNLPIAIGFGIKTAEDVKALSGLGNAVVVGSSIVQQIADHGKRPGLEQIIGKQVKILALGLHK